MPRRHKRSKRPGELLGSVAVLAALIGVAIYAGLPADSRLSFLAACIVLLLAGAIAVFTLALWKRDKERQKLQALDMAGVATMDGLVFERYLAELLRRRGYSGVRLTERFDLGVDIIAIKDGVRWGVQAKRYSKLVRAEAVRFSRPAKQLAEANQCVLVDSDRLAEWILQSKSK